MSLEALLVEPDSTDALLLIPLLSVLGFRVTTVGAFQDAKQALRPTLGLLMTEVRLGEFNGLHLVLRARSVSATIPTIVTSGVDDPVLRAEAESMGATFIVKPFIPSEVRAAIQRTVLRRQDLSFEPIRAPFERRQGQRRIGTSAHAGGEKRHSDRRVSALRFQFETAERV